MFVLYTGFVPFFTDVLAQGPLPYIQLSILARNYENYSQTMGRNNVVSLSLTL